MSEDNEVISSLRRALKLLRIIAAGPPSGMRLKDIAHGAQCSQPTAHRVVQDMIAEGFVERATDAKRYRPAIDFFVLAARAGQVGGLRELAKPALLRLSATLRDTVFLLVRDGYDAVCLDRADGPFPIVSFTGDIGGKIPLGLGQGGMAILAYLPPAEMRAVISFNMPRLLDCGFIDEAALRTAIRKTQQDGWASMNTGLIPGMAGVGVPVLDAHGVVVAALSIGTLAERLDEARTRDVAGILNTEAAMLGSAINPFDSTLRRPSRSLSLIQDADQPHRC